MGPRPRRKKSGRGRWVLLLVALLLLLGTGAGVVYLRRAGPGVTPPAASPPPAPGDTQVSPAPSPRQEVQLFFSSPDGEALVVETRSLDMGGDATRRCLTLLAALVAGPEGTGALPLLPRTLEVRTVFMVEGTAVVDFGPALRQHPAGALQELLLWRSLVNTLIMNQQDVNGIRILIDGREEGPRGSHLDLRGVQKENLDLVRWNR